VVAHRHFGPHHVHADHLNRAADPVRDNTPADHDNTPADHDNTAEDHDPPEFDDDDSVVATVDGVFIAPAAFVLLAPDLPIESVVPPPAAVTARRPVAFVERLIHGPPRAPTLLRGPPSTSRL
jgi:hypothetical protein